MQRTGSAGLDSKEGLKNGISKEFGIWEDFGKFYNEI
jgi:hypothetical protein